MSRENWKDQVPSNYFCQILWQLLATGWEFSILKAQLKTQFGDEVYLQTKHYHIERKDVKEDLEYLQEEAIKFWEKVQKKECPDLLLPNIIKLGGKMNSKNIKKSLNAKLKKMA